MTWSTSASLICGVDRRGQPAGAGHGQAQQELVEELGVATTTGVPTGERAATAADQRATWAAAWR